MDKKRLQNYAKLIVRAGINVQKGQEVIVRCGLDQPEFVAMVVEECYKCGAERVKVEWSYMPVTKINYIYRSLETLSEVTEVEKAEHQRRVDKLSCMIWLDSDDPDGLKGTDSEKISKASMARYPILKPFNDALDNKYQWCIAAVPGKEWAEKVFPDLKGDQAIEALWEAILNCSRVDDDPVAAWDEHNKNLAIRCEFLNKCRFERLEYKSSNGTDFTVGLNPKALFMGGGEKTQGRGVYFNPNIPTEEVFTSPLSGCAEGKVIATKPLSYQGKLIENFGFEFKNGKVVECFAEKNVEVLEKMIAMDEGASRLGEVALIGYNSPINNTGLLFYSTLFDENASCHLALGRGFTNTIENYENYTQEEFEKMGVNSSMIHVDFMIGDKDTDIFGVTKDGERVQIFKNGDWCI